MTDDALREAATAAIRLIAAIGYISQDGDPVCEFCCCRPGMDLQASDWHAANCPTRVAIEWVAHEAESRKIAE